MAISQFIIFLGLFFPKTEVRAGAPPHPNCFLWGSLVHVHQGCELSRIKKVGAPGYKPCLSVLQVHIRRGRLMSFEINNKRKVKALGAAFVYS